METKERTAAVAIEGLWVRFGSQVVLPGLSVEIPGGEIVGLLGPSGSGKTTLVKAVMGMGAAQAGKIEVLGRRVPSFGAMSAVGYMAQNDALYGDLSALDNLLFFARLCGLRGGEARARAEELLDFAQLSAHRKKAVRFFSGGMKRRLSLAVSLLGRPKLLILDEPTVGVDPVLRLKFWEKFRALREEGCTILATTHVMDEAERCDRILLLREGRILANGTPAGLLAETGAANIEGAFLRFCGGDAKEAV